MSANCATLEVDLSALTQNYRLLKSKLAGGDCAAVVKANAYGLGVEMVSKTLWSEGCRQFFVATLAEGIELRGMLPEARQIYVFHGVLAGEENAFIEHQLMPVINTTEQFARWGKIADRSQGAALHIDTGITRLGLSETDMRQLTPAQLAKAKVQLIISHLACAHEKAHPKNAEQLLRFQQALKLFPGIAASLANSAGIFLSSDYHYDLARPGCALYGIHPTEGINPMQHVATLSAPLLQLRTLDRDETVGYGAAYAAKKGSRIALVGLGYSDGYFRLLGNKGFATVAGMKVPIAGRISMDMIALDLSALPEGKLSPSLRAEFINSSQTVNDIAEQCQTIGYEVFTRIGRRVVRTYR
jgi:alanine racemase